MKGWFARLPIHRKLVASALLITAAALLLATLGLSVFDILRFRAAASDDAGALARVLAENTAAAVVFSDADAARETLQSVRVRAVVTRACVFLPDGALFAGFARPGAVCPARADEEGAWTGVVGTAPIARTGRTYGTVYVERRLADLQGRLVMTLLVGLGMLLLAASAAFVLAQRVHTTISEPITQLAGYARVFGSDPNAAVPAIRTSPDEIGDLVRSFTDMVTRVRVSNERVISANDELTRTNEALRRENEERRRAEGEREQALGREREANRLKDEFLAAVSHELRTPLNAMMGWAQILASARPSEETARRALASIVKNGEAQTRVIDDLVDVSRIVTGKLRMRFQPIDVRLVVASAVESIGSVAAAKGVRLEPVVPAHSCVVAGDPDRLQQVLWNLLSNAVKFTPRGGRVTIDVSRDGDRIRVSVSDTGIGIAPSFLPHVFERFRQADGSMTREHGGLGLGLAIVKELIELHGGSVAAASAGPGAGATFSVLLRECNPEPEITEVDGASAEELPSLSGVRVLAVDDSDDAAAIVSAALTCAGAQVDTCTSADAALDACRQRIADVLVCDLAMPGMGGVELLARIRELAAERGGPTPAAIAVSAQASEQHHADSLRGGFQMHLSKPLDGTALVRAVASLVVRRS